jgi:hypothetical protein
MENKLEERAKTLSGNRKYAAELYGRLARSKAVGALMLILLFGSGMVAWAFLQPLYGRAQIDPKFQAAHASVVELGSPLGPSEASAIYEEAHEHALVLWVGAPAIHFVLFSNNRVMQQTDTDWNPGPQWMDETWVRNQLKLPKECSPPLSGVARDWNNDPDRWKVIGCRTWNCRGAAFVQEFSNGTIIGPISYTPTESDSDPLSSKMIVILKDKDKWIARPSSEPASKCPPGATG